MDFIKLCEGSYIFIDLIKNKLESKKIYPIVKSENKSARLAGFGFNSNDRELFVHKNSFMEAKELIKTIEIKFKN